MSAPVRCIWISAPVDARPATGNHPSQTENTSLRSIPAKNTGVAYTSTADTRSVASAPVSRRAAASRPSGMPTANATTSA